MEHEWIMLRGQPGAATVLIVTAVAALVPVIAMRTVRRGTYAFVATPPVGPVLLALARMVVVLGDVARGERERIEGAIASLRPEHRGIVEHVTDGDSAMAVITAHLAQRTPLRGPR